MEARAVVRPSRLSSLVAVTIAALLAAAALPLATGQPPVSAPPGAAVQPSVVSTIEATGSAEVIVRVAPGYGAEALAAVEAGGGEVSLPLPIVDGFAATLTHGGLERLEALGIAIRGVTLDAPVRMQHVPPGGEAYDDSSFVETIGADRLHAKGYDGSGVGIALIDTGVSQVEDLEGRIVGGIDLTADRDGVDRYGHGTFVAGVAAGDGASSDGEHAGVAPGAHIVPVKIASGNGAADVSHVLAAIQWVVSFKDTHDIEVLNLSFGTDSTQSYLIDPMNYAVEKAWQEGIVVVVAASNAGPDPKSIFKPADDPFVITVGATDSTSTVDRRDDTVPGWSGRGPTRADGLAKPDLVAPGAHIISLRSPSSTIDSQHPEARVGDAYFRGSGTSFSAAVTSGAAALLKQMHPEWSPDQVKQALFDLAVAGPVGDENVDGNGALDVGRAHQLDRPGNANAGKEQGTGTGSLDASRGHLLIEVERDGLLGVVEQLLDGKYTAQDLVFNGLEYRTTEWTGSNWWDSQWSGSNWWGSNWWGSNWWGSNWWGSNWWGSNWW